MDCLQVKSDPDEVYVACPFCGDEQKRMGINVNLGIAHCFRASCEWKTTDKRHLFRELAKVLNVTETLDRTVSRKLPRKIKKPRPSGARCRLPEGYEKFTQDSGDEVEQQAWSYLLNRGMTPQQIFKHHLGYAAVGEQAYRIIIPIYRNGKLVAYTGRDFTGTQTDLKYKNSPGPKYLYNLPRRKHSKVLLLEGPADVWAAERALDRIDVIGRLGAGLTKQTLKDLLAYDEIIIWPDPDKGGIEMAIGTAQSLDKRGRRVRIVMPQSGDVDPGKLGESEDGLKEIREKVKAAVNYSDAVRLKLRAFVAFETPTQKRRNKTMAFL
jgi:DNA primase